MIDKRLNIVGQLFVIETHLAHHRVNVAAFVVAEFDFSRLVFRNRLRHIPSLCAELEERADEKVD